MLFVNIFLTAIVAVSSTAALVTRRTTQDKYQVVEMTWTGVVEEGGEVMSFKGTIEVTFHRTCLIDQALIAISITVN
jgi:hypothetical protein